MDFKKEDILQKMFQTGLVPVFNHSDLNIAKKVLDACYAGGVRVFEFTNRDSSALQVFNGLALHAQNYKDLVLGIGTVFTAKQAQEFLDVGAQFLVSPALIKDISKIGNQNDKLWIPGCGTITEMYRATEWNAEIIKIFPGNVLGPGFIKSAKAVFPNVPMMPTGGVSPDKNNLSGWFNAGVSCVGMGSKLIDKEILQHGNFNALEKKVVDVVGAIRALKFSNDK